MAVNVNVAMVLTRCSLFLSFWPFFPHKEYLLEPDVVGKIRDLDLEAEAENKVLTSILNEALEGSTKVKSSIKNFYTTTFVTCYIVV